MIESFKCSETQRLFEGDKVLSFVNFQTVAERKLAMLHRARHINDLRIPPNNRLEKLSGDRAGQWSIRINAQWRLCFEWHDGQACNVEIVDYR